MATKRQKLIQIHRGRGEVFQGQLKYTLWLEGKMGRGGQQRGGMRSSPHAGFCDYLGICLPVGQYHCLDFIFL